MTYERGQLPKAYLRIDPNLDQTHPAPGDMVTLMCAANRQPKRGWFKSAELARIVLGAGLFRRSSRRGDLVMEGDRMHVAGWDEWQEGDITVGERMRQLRKRQRNNVTNGTVTLTVTPASRDRTAPSEASGVRRRTEMLNETPTGTERAGGRLVKHPRKTA